MPVSNIDPYFSVESHGGNTYPFAFKIFDASEMVVKVDGTVKTLGLDYTVTITAEPGEGGSIIFQPGFIPPLGTLTVEGERAVTVDRSTDYQEAGGFRQSVVDKDFDRLVMMAQDGKRGRGVLQGLIDSTLAMIAQVAATDSALLENFSLTFRPLDIITKGPWLDARAYATLTEADAAAVAAGKLLLISTVWDVAADMALLGAVKVIAGGGVNVAAGKTLAISGSFEAGPYQVFFGMGSVSLVSDSSVKWFGALGDAVTDDTAAIQKAIASSRTVIFPFGRYMVSTINFNNPGGNYIFNGAVLRGSATVSTAAVVEITVGFMHFTNLLVDQNWNNNYTAAIKWHSLTSGTPAQFNMINGLYISNAIVGILYGQFDGTTVVDSPQSENDIYRYTTRGVQKAIYYNQPNGGLRVHGGSFGVSKAEWDLNTPGAFNYANGRVVEQYQGTLELLGCELLAAENSTSVGFEVKGGSLNISGGQWEIAGINLLLSNCNVSVYGVASAYFSSATLNFLELVTATTGKLVIDGFRLVKATGTDVNTQAFLQTNATPNWDVTLSNVIAERQQRSSLIKSSGANNTYLTNIKFSNFRVRGTAGNVDISSTPANLVDVIKGNTLATLKNLWWLAAGSGGSATIDTIDVPAVAGRTYANSLKLDGTGTDRELLTMDRTSNATVLATAIPVVNGRHYLIEGWFKHEGAGITSLRLVAYTSAFAPTGLVVADSSNLISTTWTYIRAIYRMPDTADYIGIGVKAVNSIARMVDVKISRVD